MRLQTAQEIRASLGPADEVARIFDAFEKFQLAYHQQGTSSQARVYFRLLMRYTAEAQRRRALDGIICCVAHAPGTCCHYGERLAGSKEFIGPDGLPITQRVEKELKS